MSRASVLAAGQAIALASMVDTCVIKRRGADTMDPFSGTSTTPLTTLYTGQCRVQAARAEAFEHDAGQDFLLLLRLEVQLPVSVTGLEVADEITITAATHDPDLVGRVFRIHDLMHKTEPTARRVQVTERTGS